MTVHLSGYLYSLVCIRIDQVVIGCYGKCGDRISLSPGEVSTTFSIKKIDHKLPDVPLAGGIIKPKMNGSLCTLLQ